ncbi:hypothetical protein MMC09_006857 [Bachmanniomyces sp. S44760]|nr:hypothetical protein [Bachmanniomyces sp. S44760]
MAGLIAMTATLVVVGIEMFFATRGAGHIHGSEYDAAPEEEGVHASHNGDLHHKRHRSESMRRFQSGASGKDFTGSGRTSMERLINEDTPSMTSGEPSPSMANGTTYHDEEHNDDDRDSNEDLDLDELDPASGSSTLLASTASRKRASSYSHQASSAAPPNNHHHGPLDPNSPLAQKKLLLQCLLLEAGILFHSVFIGIALSVATGTPFVVLLVAISFHQTFEGLALGSRIAAITSFAPSSPKPWLMALAYGTTTPVGQAIGLGVQGLYDPKGVMGLLMVGVMNAVSSGLLLFAGLVELLAEDFLSERSYETLRGRRRLQACASVVAGAGLMAFVGAWA